MRRSLCTALACMSIFGCLCTNVLASEVPMVSYFDMSNVSVQASTPLNVKVSAYKTGKASTAFYLAAGETVTISASYTPKNASVDFGLIDKDNTFHYINTTSGSINETIRVPLNGNYFFAIKNNSGTSITVTGTINY